MFCLFKEFLFVAARKLPRGNRTPRIPNFWSGFWGALSGSGDSFDACVPVAMRPSAPSMCRLVKSRGRLTQMCRPLVAFGSEPAGRQRHA